MSKFSKIKLGDKAELRHKISASDIDAFVDLTGDDNKIHINNEYAQKTSFKKPVAHGMLSASFISTIIGTKLPGDGALWFSQKLSFLLPVRVGDEILVKAEVVKKIEKQNIIELSTDIFNQKNQKVVEGLASVKVIEPEVESEEQLEEPDEKIALIIGSTGGIGTSVSKRLALEGYKLILHYNKNKALANNLKNELEELSGNKPIVVQADITDEHSVFNLFSRIERDYNTISAFVNCATFPIPQTPFLQIGWEEVSNQLDINLRANFLLLKRVIPIMLKKKKGKIITISTEAIESTPASDWISYVTAKSALSGFVKSLALEFGPKGININMVSPGMTDTDLISDIPEKARLLYAAKVPSRRLAKPEEVAGVVKFLVSEDSNYMVGETIRLNGGKNMI
jgi:3-oxoacyl-[acyl-carrier protein] reductase